MARKTNGPERRGPFSMLYLPWIQKCAELHLSNTQILVLLLLLSRLEFDDHGNAYAWYPREEMARELGKSDSTIKQATHVLLKKEVLKTKKKAFKGRCPEYYIFPGIPWPTVKGSKPHTPKKEKGVSKPVLQGSKPHTPLIKEGVRTAPEGARHVPQASGYGIDYSSIDGGL